MIPGTILIVDDKEGEVKNLVNEFVQRGENAFYSGVPFGHKHCENNIRDHKHSVPEVKILPNSYLVC
jgi:hypothetical protein